jgi:hypothetical protein
MAATTLPTYHYPRDNIMDATAIGAILGVVGSIIVFVFLGVRIMQLMKSCNSQD